MMDKAKNGALPTQILIGLAVGAVAGLIAHATLMPSPALESAIANFIEPFGKIFLRLIFMVVIPLIVSAIILGVAEMGDFTKLGKIGARCMILTVLFAGTSVAIGIGLTNLFKPGDSLPESKRAELVAAYGSASATAVQQGTQKQPLAQTLLNLIPVNPLAEAANSFSPNYTGGGILAVMVFALLFGIALSACKPEESKPVLDFLRGLFAAALVINGWAMRLAPVGVACLIFTVVAKLGFDLVQTLGGYILLVVGGLLLHLLGTYSIALKVLARTSPLEFFRQIRAVIITAFSTSSSNVTLPLSLRTAEENLGLPPKVSRFVLTLGASANQNGTALYEGITVLFLAQVFGVDLTLAQQVTVALLCVLAGIGTAGVPGGSLPLVVGVLVGIGVPGEAIAIILGVDRILDMCRTVVNVTGDLVCAKIVAHWEAGDRASETAEPVVTG